AIATGYYQLTHLGNAGFRTEKKIHGLAEGTYYWSVQALDHAHKGSDFAPEETFNVCYDLNLGRDTAICLGGSISFSVASVPFIQSVEWSTTSLGVVSTANTYSHPVVGKDTLIAEVTKTFGCVVYDSIIVDAFALPVFHLGNDTSVCFQEVLPLSVASSGIVGLDSVAWHSTNLGLLAANEVAIAYEVATKDTIIAQAFNVNGCVYIDSVIVDTYALPDFNLGNDATVCFQESMTLSVSSLGIPGLDSVNWFSSQRGVLGSDTEFIDYQVLTKDTIVAEVFNVNGCVSYDTLIVDAFDLPAFSLGADTSLCIGEALPLSVSGLGIVGLDSVNWYANQAGPLATDAESISYHALVRDTIVAEVFNTNGCVGYDTIIVDVNALPVFSIGADTAICYDEAILLQVDPSFDTINWYSERSGFLLESDSWFFNYEVTETDRIITEVYDGNGCLNYDTIAIAMNPLPVFSVADQEVCLEDTATLTVPGNWQEVNWYTFGDQLLRGADTTYRFSVEATTTLWAEVYSLAGCVNYDTATVTRLELPVFDLGPDRRYCYEDSVQFDVGDIGIGYAWINRNDVLVSTDYPWTYLAEETDSLLLLVENADGCFYEDSLIVTVNPLPTFDIQGTDEICAMDTTTLSISHSDILGINWYTASEDTLFTESLSYDYSPPASGWLFAGLTDRNACVATDSVFVTVNERPEALAGDDVLICFEQDVTLGGTYPSLAGLSFAWSPASTLSATDVADPVARPLEPTTYYLEVTNTEGCNARDTVYVEVNPEIIVDAGEDLSVCLGDSVALGGAPTASGSGFPYTYVWSPSEDLLAVDVANPVAVPKSSGAYVVEVQSGNCLVERDTVQVRVNLAPEISVSLQQSVGPNQSIQLVAEGGVDYFWQPEELLDDPESATPLASPLETTEFEVLITDENGCDSTGYVNVLVQNEVFIPNLFTPNGDGNNDHFKVFGSGIAAIRLVIYDLNGKQLFVANSMEQAVESGWDGTSGGRMLPNGTYIWVLEGSFHSGAKLSFGGKNNGTVKLMR
ncbi:MAG: gliding motility-associated C-terminal domain-containing protein, partial [Bacteroidota bacterium]